jgi:protein gp37
MGKNSSIEWTEHTFNPWWGCTKISEGCALCYAKKFAARTGYGPDPVAADKFPIWGDNARRRLFGDKHWDEPKEWQMAAARVGVMHRVFCGSMCDILENREELKYPRQVTTEMVASTPNLLWLFLTKRPENAVKLLPLDWRGNGNWPRNVMLGVTIENQKRLEIRVPVIRSILRDFPGAAFFASCEPLLSALEWEGVEGGYRDSLDLFDWVIGGGESGPGARPMHPDWIRKLRDDCENRTDMGRPWPVPFLFKQWGEFQNGSTFSVHASKEFVVLNDGQWKSRVSEFDQDTRNAWSHKDSCLMARVGKKEAGRVLDGRTWDGTPILTYGPQIPGHRGKFDVFVDEIL